MKVSVNRDTCISMGECVLAAGDVFDQGEEDGVVQIVGSPEGREDAVRKAAAACPTHSIIIEED